MARTPQDVTDAELAVLRILWDQGHDKIRPIAQALYPEGTAAHYATVQKLLERLEVKEFVRRDRTAWPHRFEPLVSRQELIRRRLQQTADQLGDGTLPPLLALIVRTARLTAIERHYLRALLDEAEQSPD